MTSPDDTAFDPAGARRALLGQQGCVVWFTGLSGSGKSTLARVLEKRLLERGRLAYVLDGDEIRRGLNTDLAFSLEDRAENLRRVAEVARMFAECGVICISAFISPLCANREAARDIVGARRFFEVHLAADLEACERRDAKGLYRKARAGLIPEFTGISSPYEPPRKPDLRLDTVGESIEANVQRLVDLLDAKGMLGTAAGSPS